MSDNGLETQQVRKKTFARNRKREQRLATSADEKSTELSKQRKRMRLLRDRETPARWSAKLEARLRSNERTQEESSENSIIEYIATHGDACRTSYILY